MQIEDINMHAGRHLRLQIATKLQQIPISLLLTAPGGLETYQRLIEQL